MMSCLWFEKLLPWNVHSCHLLGTSCARAAKRSSYTDDLHSINKDIQMVHSPIKKSPAPFTCRGWGGRGQLCQGCSCPAQKPSRNVLQFEPGEIRVKKYLFQHSHLSHWLHQCVPHHNRNICPTEKSIMTRLSRHGFVYLYPSVRWPSTLMSSSVSMWGVFPRFNLNRSDLECCRWHLRCFIESYHLACSSGRSM